MTNVSFNNELNGIEIRFDGKPAAQVIESMKANGFRWSGKQKMWYAKQNAGRIAFAKTISEVNEASGSASLSDTITNKCEQLHTYDLFEMTRTDGIENNYEKYRIHDCKEIAAIIRKHIRERFKMCRWSVTSDYNSIRVEMKSSPFAKDSDEVAAIVHYVYKFAQSYNYDNSDSMSDYFDVNFYGVYESQIVDYDYQQTEMTVEMMNVSELFRERKAAFEVAERERQEREYQEMQKKRAAEQKEAERLRAEWKVQHELIEAAAVVTDADYFVMNAVTSTINKMNTVESIEEYEKKERDNCKVTREVRLPENLYRLFENHLLSDYSFLAGMGGTATDDLRVQSMMDYEMMDKEERATVEWYCTNCVAVYCDDVLKLVINPEGFSYARYTYIVDEESERREEYHGSTGITEEDCEQNRYYAEMVEDASMKIIMENNLYDVFDKDGFDLYRAKMKDWLYNKSALRLTVGIVQAIGIERLKAVMYRILRETESITEQFKRAELTQGQRLTLYYISDFGSIVEQRIAFDSVSYGKYAQYDNAVKLTFKPEHKRGLYYNWFYRDMLVIDGWYTLPESVLWETEHNAITGVTVKHSRFMSCDRKQYDAILEHFKSLNIEPIINTYKPQF